MRFNYESKPAHPRKVYRIMQDFLNENVELFQEHEYITNSAPFPDNAEDMMEWLENSETIIENERVFFHVHKGKNSCAWVDDKNGKIEINLTSMTNPNEVAVYQNACSRSATLKGFSMVTFTLLHEAGHHMVAEEMEDIEDTIEKPDDVIGYAFAHANNWKEFYDVLQSFHYNKPHEQAATNWAIKFLSDPNNRKKTKAFEKAFFKAWRG